jgi:hypothetical protein
MPSAASVFNVFQDAVILEIDGVVPGVVRMVLDCDYLRDRLEGPGSRFFITLENCTRFSYTPRDEPPALLQDLAVIAGRRLWLSSADQYEGYFVVHCSEHAANGSGGKLEVAADRVVVTIDSGREINPSELEDIAEEYWSGFGIKKQQ